MSRPDLALFAATSGHSGVDRIVANLLPALAAHGLRIDLLGIRGHGPCLDPLPAGVRRIDLGRDHVLPALPALVRYLRRERPRVLLSDKDKVNRTALWARRLAGGDTRGYVRLGTTVSTNLASRPLFDRLTQRWSMRTFYAWADGVLVPSQGVAADFAAFAGLPRTRIQVVPNPVVTPQLQALAAAPPPHPWLLDSAVPVILGVGELSERKDFATLLRAFARLHATRPCRLLIYGEGRRRGQLAALAAELGVAADVALPGFIANPYPAMAHAAAFALTSRWEGLGIVLVEALALGTPAVACDCPSGPREVLADGRHGPLVAVGDDAALAAALAGLLDAPPAREQLVAAAAAYSVEASARAYAAALGLEPTP
ncbi:glycosyltransferase [Plasticicumulans acidivorans]|uniref:Glycosyltransferase involved in cell wall biosynthesis n=1 Tax=Plasticicumulans acidivorans TaxID=886464 RepID=A0A317MW18_9GAMM|nr:glycosyltransferase [Plasticicumulans acidivorans]PWV62521.1 glycosyltransferase involved in cell wall biosynthesis [Plasticicumulans acidivorans]